MRKKLLTMMVIVSALSLGACADENAIDEMLKEDIELNHSTDPGDECKDITDPTCGG